MTTTLKDSIPHLNIELLKNGCIRLENEDQGDSYVVDIHQLHLRHMAEKLGLIPEVSATNAELLRIERGRMAEMRRDMDRYKRALFSIRSRAEQLYENVYKRSQTDDMDLGIEIAQAAAIADFADHVCTEFEASFSQEPVSQPACDMNVTAGDKLVTKKAKGQLTTPLFELALDGAGEHAIQADKAKKEQA